MGANAGIFFAGDWFTFILSWELMGWSSYLIVSHGREESGKAGLYYFILSLIGTATLLTAIALLTSFVKAGNPNMGFSEIIVIQRSIDTVNSLWGINPIPIVVTILLIITFFAKSAVFPFYMWPAKAHAEAPDDFSAFLSGIMIKYGAFGLIAFVLPMFANYVGADYNGLPLPLVILGWIGAVTAVLGTLYAIRQNDMKRLMAYSTVGNIGYIITALSMNSSLGITGAMFHIFNHMVFKGAIFLTLAAVKYRTGIRDMHKLGGLAYKMPITFFTFLIGIIAAAGIPPMSGFGSKWLMIQSLFDRDFLFMVIPIFFASTGAFMYLFRGLHTILLGQLSPRFNSIKEAPPLQSIAMTILMLLVVAVGFIPGLVLEPIKEAVSSSLNFSGIESTMFSITGSTSAINFTIAGGVFMGAFIIVLILFLIGKKRQVIKDPLDRYTSAEIPEEWGLTPEKYHFGLNFYDYFEKMVNPILNATSFDRLFKRIAYEIERLSGSIGRWFKNISLSKITLFALIVLILIIGWFMI
jgi:NADH-quinone oxidoreductase subunit M